jgi:hypothetical protein
MAAYTTNEDLALYVASVQALPDSMARMHEEAYRQIRRDLVFQGWVVEALDALTVASLEGLKVPACHYVLYLLFQGQTHDRSDVLFERSKHHLAEYHRTLAKTTLESTYVSEDGTEAAGYGDGMVMLG